MRLLFLSLFLLPYLVQAALPPAKAAAIDAAIAAEMAKDQAVGVAIGILQKDEVVYVRGYGLADREKKIPVDAETMFRWASCSKPVCALAALQLAERGQFDLDADVRKYVPEFPDRGVKITARQLLCHQGGIVHYSNGQVIATKAAYTTPHPFEDPVVALNTFKESPLLSTPGTRYSYSSYGYLLLSAVMQRAGRETFSAQIQQRIARPLALPTLQIDYPWVAIPHRAAGYRRQGTEVVLSTDTDMSWKAGAGCFISNIRDFAGFARGLLRGGLVKPQTQELMWQPQKTADGAVTTYGLGFVVDEPRGRLRIAHDGRQEKTRTRFVIYPREHHGIVVMTNSEWVDPGQYSTLIYTALAKP